MDLKDFAAISGKGGLFRVVKPTRSGIIVESIDENKKKMVASASNRISILEEISLYTNTAEGAIPLKDVMQKIYEEFKDDTGLTSSSSPQELTAFIEHLVPEYDKEKVYASDIKKIVTWYNILIKYHPEIFEQKQQEEEKSGKENKKEVGKETKEEKPAAEKSKPKEEKTANPTEKKEKSK